MRADSPARLTGIAAAVLILTVAGLSIVPLEPGAIWNSVIAWVLAPLAADPEVEASVTCISSLRRHFQPRYDGSEQHEFPHRVAP